MVLKYKGGVNVKVYLSNRARTIKAEGIYNTENKTIIVKAGAIVSETISESKSFGGVNKIIKLRNQNCKGLITQNDIEFKSASTAANFILGTSTNGLLAWRDIEGNKLKDLINLSDN